MSKNSSVPYVSVVKINGQPILPPLITPELRKELLNYKKQAIKLEKLLKNCSELRKNVEELLEESRPTSQITFGDNSHIEALNISEKPKPDAKEPRKLKNIHLSKDLIEVTEYNGNQGLKLIDNPDNFRYRSYSVSGADFPKPSTTPPKPRLIRSNSYTLDSPSPILLEHLKNKASLNEEIKSPSIEVYQTDISVQQITVNNSGLAKKNKKEGFLNKNADSELIEALKDIPENYANQIIDLLKQQHVEQKERLDRYDRLEKTQKPIQDNLIDFSSFIDYEAKETMDTPNQKLRRSSTFSMSPSQSLYYSLTSDGETLQPELGVLQEKNGYWEGYLIHGCNRELFPKTDTLEKEWAASVIGAHVKGFLTRRLLKTDKVQALIATVKDVLVCAVELHRSNIIDEKDVELHRRLINQLSAALYAFHDVFFELSVKEQMAVIAADRQRKIEKMKRPQSGRKTDTKTPSRSSSQHKLTPRQNLTKV